MRVIPLNLTVLDLANLLAVISFSVSYVKKVRQILTGSGGNEVLNGSIDFVVHRLEILKMNVKLLNYIEIPSISALCMHRASFSPFSPTKSIYSG